ncbi:MAG: RecQ family ATP-dependent DNA helicase [Bacteroidales bacterium]|nr:RecQ family ATP-dependent DNA helicase [Bacteroidales bacterium]
MNRTEAEKRLKATFGFDHFYDEQWEGIQALLNRQRVLMIQKTGFGKSLVFQFPACQLDGTTIVFSPLIALMREQVNRLIDLGIRATVLNSTQSFEEKAEVLKKAKDGYYKLLYIAPERQEDVSWLDAVKEFKISMVVIDEAHCISTWGHDFRPSYRRIVSLIKLLPGKFPILACTATATMSVQNDIENQLGGELTILRGNLLRENFSLNVVWADSQEAKMSGVVSFLRKTEGSGIIYCGTQIETEIYSRWLQFVGINAVNYHGGLDDATRRSVETGLMKNSYKCVVATNALGMGIDKPDIRFIIHVQIPPSPLHYYQEIGRAGRDGKPTKIILFYNSADDQLPLSFIEGNRPSVRQYQKTIDVLKEESLKLHGIIRLVNMKQTAVNVILNDLVDQKIVSAIQQSKGKLYELRFGAPELDTSSFEQLREFKLKEFEELKKYLTSSLCRMKFLCNYLGDDQENDCGSCDSDRGEKYAIRASSEWLEKIKEFRESYFPKLKLETKKSVLSNGVASSYYGVTEVGNALHRSKYENGGDFPDFLLRLTLKAFRGYYGQKKFDLIIFVPPTESGDLVRNFAEKISKVLRIQISYDLKKRKETKPQKEFESAIGKKSNVCGAFIFEGNSINGKRILIIDDIFDSGHTIKEIAKVLQKHGAVEIAPLVIAKTVGGR